MGLDMARYEMAGAELASMAGLQPTSQSLFELGIIYATGRSGVTDLVAAHKWFNLAAMRGNDEALRHRQELAREMSPVDVATALRAARDWLKTH
jgi:TPR repeat protein